MEVEKQKRPTRFREEDPQRLIAGELVEGVPWPRAEGMDRAVW
jgi:hypothetical protein